MEIYYEDEMEIATSFPTQVIWNSWVPSKVNFFAWEAL